MDPNKEERLLEAQRALLRGDIRSERAAAKIYGVSRSTLQARRQGRPPQVERHSGNTRLTTDQEKTLALYIRDLQLQYASLDRRVITNIVWRLAGSDPMSSIGVN